MRAPRARSITETRRPVETAEGLRGHGELADAMAGTYRGNVIADSKDSSQSGVTVTIVKVSG